MSYRAGTRYQTAELQGLQGEIALATGQSGGGAYFLTMTKLAEDMGTPLMQALGLFGQAAADPYEAVAIKCAAKAQQLVHAMMVGLDHDAVTSFWSTKERTRVMQRQLHRFQHQEDATGHRAAHEPQVQPRDDVGAGRRYCESLR